MDGGVAMLMPSIVDYLEVRRAAGFKLHEAEKMLRQFVEYAASRGDTHVRARTAIEWASQARTKSQKHLRLCHVVRAARYLRAEDPEHEVPPPNLFPRAPRQLNPYVYTPAEAQLLVDEAAKQPPPGPLQPYTFSTIFALLFATGLRISEALALRFDDVTKDGLLIRQGKSQKSRIVPLHETAQAGLQRYLARRRAVCTATDRIFINTQGRPLRYNTVNDLFRQIRRSTCLQRPPGQPQPRIHDIRHTFAVRALEASPDSRDRIAQHMLALATYLGHSQVADTYWYLQATPRLMRDIADACETMSNKEETT